MKLYEMISNIKTREDFIAFVDSLVKDLQDNPNEWENNDLKSFLNAMIAWTGDMEGFYKNQGKEIPTGINWEVFANILYASKMYE